MTKINIEINQDYKQYLDILKQIIPNKQGQQVASDSEMVEVLIEEFMAFVQQHAQAHEGNEGGCCGGHGHDKDNHECCGGKGHGHGEGHGHGKGGCGCNH